MKTKRTRGQAVEFMNVRRKEAAKDFQRAVHNYLYPRWYKSLWFHAVVFLTVWFVTAYMMKGLGNTSWAMCVGALLTLVYDGVRGYYR